MQTTDVLLGLAFNYEIKNSFWVRFVTGFFLDFTLQAIDDVLAFLEFFFEFSFQCFSTRLFPNSFVISS